MTNVIKLMIHKMSIDGVPPGGGVNNAVRFILEPGRMSASAKEAKEWVKAAIEAVRLAAEPNPWKNADDETIAGELLSQIAQRRGRQCHE